MKTKNRFVIIALVVLLMISAIVIIEVSLQQEGSTRVISHVDENAKSSIPMEQGVFRRSSQALEYASMPFDTTSGRSLENYYKNRAFNGAPPTIPHELLSEEGIGGRTCLQCHKNGGYVERFRAYTPITPHPEMLNCRQCHVAQKAGGEFVGTYWVRPEPFQIDQAALPGSPPIIPHELQMRENCLACHAGPAAPKEIRIDHADRVNCRQCHAATKQFDSNSMVFYKQAE